ncbi:MAG: hypothetical protein B7X95_08390 [Methylophilaceae bacterium 17-44-8]|jgi:hypothetical protein|nr:MAG: hypothetical protein B7Y48_05955 [Methylophilales bacterium 28-44-11]OZA04933.1 MAG: hypothetical protein B7X95_08390 [Methylophilaceae bacterium 17-44-8]
MNKYVFGLSLVAALSALPLSANALSQGGSGLTSMTHTNTNTTSSLVGMTSSSTNAVDVIQPMVQSPKVIKGKVSAMGSAVNTIQPMVDAPKTN